MKSSPGTQSFNIMLLPSTLLPRTFPPSSHSSVVFPLFLTAWRALRQDSLIFGSSFAATTVYYSWVYSVAACFLFHDLNQLLIQLLIHHHHHLALGSVLIALIW
jgi:hypothetical protein